jgi:MFS transporter, CP family, cyanate transporter
VPRRAPLLLPALLLVALNLRPALTSVGPLVHDVRADLGVSSGTAGLLTTLPVLAFGIVAPLAPVLAHRFRLEAVLLGCMLALAAGLALRLAGAVPLLFAGTLAAGCAIAIANVLVPALVKHRFPGRATTVTGLYSVALGTGAALAAGLAVPSERWLGGSWRGALALWAIPALLAAVVWSGQLRGAAPSAHAAGAARSGVNLWRDGIAWQVTALMAIQSTLFYSVATWLPAVYRSHGIASGAAGGLLSLALIVGIPPGFGIAWLAGRMRDQRAIALGIALVDAVGFLGLLLAPVGGAVVWAILLGAGLGAGFTLVLALLVLRAPDARHATALSGMVQSIGYVLAALGPVAVGAMHDAAGSWTLPLLVLLALVVPGLAAALGASRARMVGATAAS